MPNLNFAQQDDIFDPRYTRPVTVIGAGSVGSQLVVNLAKIGFDRITVWDGDSVASHNIPMSAYRVVDVMKSKVAALQEIVSQAADVTITMHPCMYAGGPLRGPVISCTDTMEARMLIWSKVKNDPLVGLFVDTRLAHEYVEVFAIRTCDPDDIAYYEHYLYPSTEAQTPQCGEHGIVYVSSSAANAACAAMTEWLRLGTTQRHLKMLCGHIQVC